MLAHCRAIFFCSLDIEIDDNLVAQLNIQFYLVLLQFWATNVGPDYAYVDGIHHTDSADNKEKT